MYLLCLRSMVYTLYAFPPLKLTPKVGIEGGAGGTDVEGMVWAWGRVQVLCVTWVGHRRDGNCPQG